MTPEAKPERSAPRVPSTEAAPSAASWGAVGECLASTRYLLQEPQRDEWLGAWREIAGLEARLDDRLVIGLVGGTGVGKSTLINALAGAAISSSGDRRPTTDRIVAYRHAGTALPAELAVEVLAQPEVTHENSLLERVILLDFPDFDSVMELHHEIFGRYAPLLDALLLVVDDVKYADARLYELLRTLSQSPQNVHPVLNKTDRLERRYPGEWQPVAQSILEDLARKLSTHAGLHVEPSRMLALSARTAFEVGQASSTGAVSPVAAAVPADDFPRLVALLNGYREEKRRVAAKELNLEARKAAFLRRLKETVLDEGHARIVQRAAETLGARSEEASLLLGRLPEMMFGYEERRAAAANFLRRGAQHMGMPLDVLWTFLSEFRLGRKRLRKAPVSGGTELSDARGAQHYRAYFELVQNCRREIRLVLGPLALLGDDLESAAPAPSFLPAREGFQGSLATAERRLKKRSWVWNHLLALLVVLGFLWVIAYPVIRGIIERSRVGEDPGGSAVGDALMAVISALSPLSLVVLAVAIVCSYLTTALYAWLRTSHRVEGALSRAEEAAREVATEFGEKRLAEDRERIEGWGRERAALADAITPP